MAKPASTRTTQIVTIRTVPFAAAPRAGRPPMRSALSGHPPPHGAPSRSGAARGRAPWRTAAGGRFAGFGLFRFGLARCLFGGLARNREALNQPTLLRFLVAVLVAPAVLAEGRRSRCPSRRPAAGCWRRRWNPNRPASRRRRSSANSATRRRGTGPVPRAPVLGGQQIRRDLPHEPVCGVIALIGLPRPPLPGAARSCPCLH